MVVGEVSAPARAVALEEARAAVVAAIEQAGPDLIALSKFIHANPEIGYQEVRASAACADFLEARGFAVARGVADLPTAFRAEAGAGGPRVAYLSEYDALPGVGHGCGHNLIAIAGIGAGVGLQAALASVDGAVLVFGTPAEEVLGGKVGMAEAGLFDGVDAAMGAHPGTGDSTCPTIEGSGASLACQPLRIEFRGKPAHAAADPYNGVNALNALIETFNGINALRQHIRADARIHGIITDGGDAPNIIPAFAAGNFMVRAATRAYLDELVGKVRRIAEGAAAITGAEVAFLVTQPPVNDMIPNHTLARRVRCHLDALGMALAEPKTEMLYGSTDWGNVSYRVPSLEAGYPIVDGEIPWHSPEVVAAADTPRAYEATLTVAKALALTGLDVLIDPSLREAVRAEFTSALAARGG